MIESNVRQVDFAVRFTVIRLALMSPILLDVADYMEHLKIFLIRAEHASRLLHMNVT